MISHALLTLRFISFINLVIKRCIHMTHGLEILQITLFLKSISTIKVRIFYWTVFTRWSICQTRAIYNTKLLLTLPQDHFYCLFLCKSIRVNVWLLFTVIQLRGFIRFGWGLAVDVLLVFERRLFCHLVKVGSDLTGHLVFVK